MWIAFSSEGEVTEGFNLDHASRLRVVQQGTWRIQALTPDGHAIGYIYEAPDDNPGAQEENCKQMLFNILDEMRKGTNVLIVSLRS